MSDGDKSLKKFKPGDLVCFNPKYPFHRIHNSAGEFGMIMGVQSISMLQEISYIVKWFGDYSKFTIYPSNKDYCLIVNYLLKPFNSKNH